MAKLLSHGTTSNAVTYCIPLMWQSITWFLLNLPSLHRDTSILVEWKLAFKVFLLPLKSKINLFGKCLRMMINFRTVVTMFKSLMSKLYHKPDFCSFIRRIKDGNSTPNLWSDNSDLHSFKNGKLLLIHPLRPGWRVEEMKSAFSVAIARVPYRKTMQYQKH